ncbi:MAG: tryptophan synthase subunit alpha [Treponema sp.]|jgi:tryptophan synthase alpha chain|nr:tryptophan synthase subunit alpha [Treponema sp.]
MSKIPNAFNHGKAFIGFVTGGDPSIEETESYILEMIRAGTDLVEIGIPFSDPAAEGPVIQAANVRALAAGATVHKLFGMVERLRKKTPVPMVFLTYLNPVFHYGFAAGPAGRSDKEIYGVFFRRCGEAGIDGVIIPDLPFEEQEEVREAASPCGVDLISLIAPSSEDRIRRIARTASGFLYLVSSLGVTGMRSEIKTDLASITASVKACTDLPAAVGFGIHTPAQAAEIAKTADGVIVGSAIVKIIAEDPKRGAAGVYRYCKEMKDAIR